MAQFKVLYSKKRFDFKTATPEEIEQFNSFSPVSGDYETVVDEFESKEAAELFIEAMKEKLLSEN